MQALDGVVTQYVQALPAPLNQNDQEDGYLPSGEFDLPVIDPNSEDDE